MKARPHIVPVSDRTPLLKHKEAAKYLSISPATMYRLQGTAGFPAPIQIGPNSVRYFKADLDRYLQGRIGKPISTTFDKLGSPMSRKKKAAAG